MKNNSLIKIPLIVLGIAILFSIGWNVYRPEPTPIQSTPTVTTPKKDPILLCYYRADKTKQGLYDKAWLAMSVADTEVEGEFRNIPAEKDSKIGTFEGTIEKADASAVSRLATVWWNAKAEGTEIKEELLLAYNDTSASAGFGEMVKQGDTTYVYKDKSQLIYGVPMSKIDCEGLNEILIVEKYIQDNIATIATNKAVLGGTWKATSTSVNATSHTADVSYEDGHIASKGKIEYTFSTEDGKVTVTKFTVIK